MQFLFDSENYSGMSAVHENVLQPEYFMLTPPLDKPSAKAGVIADIIYSYPDHLPTNERIKEASKLVDYYKGKPTPARINEVKAKMISYLQKRAEWDEINTDSREVRYLDNKSLEIASGCIKALSENMGVQTLLHPTSIYDETEFLPSENEQAIIVDCEVEAKGLEPFIIKLKAKLDNYTIDKDNNTIVINDVKTTSKDIEFFGNVVTYYNYNREMSVYGTLLKMVVEKEYGIINPTIESNFLVVKTFPPYDTGIYTMTPELFEKGGKQFQYLLRLAAIAIYFKDYDKYLKYLHDLQGETEIL